MRINRHINFSFWRISDGPVFASAGHQFDLAVGQQYTWGRCVPMHRSMARFGDVVEVVVDPDNEFAESNKANNFMRKAIPTPLPRPPALPTRTPMP